MSTSYGPGRYDRAYEEDGPRLSARLRALDREPEPRRPSWRWSRPGSVRPEALDTEIFAFEDAVTVVRGARASGERALARRDLPLRGDPPRARASSALAVARRSRARASASRSSAPATTRSPCCCRRSRACRGPARAARDRERRLGARAAPRSSASRSAAPIPSRSSRLPTSTWSLIATRHDSHAALAAGRAARGQGGLAGEAGRPRPRSEVERGARRRARDGRLPGRRLQPPLLPARARGARAPSRRAARRSRSTTASPRGLPRAAPGSSTRRSAAAASSARSATSSTSAASWSGRRRRASSRARWARPAGRRLGGRRSSASPDGSTAALEYLASAARRPAEGALRGLGRGPHGALRELQDHAGERGPRPAHR